MTASNDSVTVVVPTYNEAGNIERIAEQITKFGYRLLVVDDKSPDGTGEIADRIAESNPNVTVLHREQKQGLGPAYAAGFDEGMRLGSRILIEMDADFSHDPADLPRLVEALDAGADMVIGSRYVPGGSTPDWPWTRRLISVMGNFYARTMLGVPTRDMTAGFRGFRVEALNALPFRTAQASGYGFQVEMAWSANRAGLKVVEVPVVFRDRTVGKSKMSSRIVIEAMGLVTKWGIKRIFLRRQNGEA